MLNEVVPYRTYDNLLFIPQMVNEILFGDGLRRHNRRALDATVALIVISDDRPGCA